MRTGKVTRATKETEVAVEHEFSRTPTARYVVMNGQPDPDLRIDPVEAIRTGDRTAGRLLSVIADWAPC